jgi:GNAT superfamily N-acetyltransferase
VSRAAKERLPVLAVASSEAYVVRRADHGDVVAVAAAVHGLLVELGGSPASSTAMQAAVRDLLETPSAGCVLVAGSAGGLVGVLAASWQLAIHVPGSYALIQEAWVDPAWRGRAVGHALLGALLELARRRGLERVEVGLPRTSFAGLAATERFYRTNGFAPLGPRMRMAL